MNEEHLRICASPEWASYVADELLPWVLDGFELGDDALELGPGPGLTTDILRQMVPRLTAVEIDEPLAVSLARRLSGTNVLVLRGDGTRLPFQPARFSAVTVLTMLHHVPSAALQDRLLAEARRVLRAGGVIAGTDGLDTPQRREVHAGDVFVPVDPAVLPRRLTAAGFADPVVEVAGDRIRFAARTPQPVSNGIGETTSDRVANHFRLFNEAVRRGDWAEFLGTFAPDAVMTFENVPAGPYQGLDAISAAYLERPPDDTMHYVSGDRAGDEDVVRFGWDAGGGGTLRMRWRDGKVATLSIAFDGR